MLSNATFCARIRRRCSRTHPRCHTRSPGAWPRRDGDAGAVQMTTIDRTVAHLDGYCRDRCLKNVSVVEQRSQIEVEWLACPGRVPCQTRHNDLRPCIARRPPLDGTSIQIHDPVLASHALIPRSLYHAIEARARWR